MQFLDPKNPSHVRFRDDRLLALPGLWGLGGLSRRLMDIIIPREFLIP